VHGIPSEPGRSGRRLLSIDFGSSGGILRGCGEDLSRGRGERVSSRLLAARNGLSLRGTTRCGRGTAGGMSRRRAGDGGGRGILGGSGLRRHGIGRSLPRGSPDPNFGKRGSDRKCWPGISWPEPMVKRPEDARGGAGGRVDGRDARPESIGALRAHGGGHRGRT